MLHLKITDAGLEIAGCGETPITFTGYSADEVNLAEMSAPLGLGPKVDAPSHRLNLREGQTLVVYSAGFRAALARFRNIQDLNVSADALVKMSGLREHPGSVLLDELQQQDWFETFNEDVSFIVIGRSSLA
jgi:serine phosphatase RsbU (regulator of sigma subunit)